MSEAVITPEVAKQLVSAIGGENLTNLTPTLEGAIKAFNNQQAEKALQMVAGEVIPFSPDDVDGVLLENLSSQKKILTLVKKTNQMQTRRRVSVIMKHKKQPKQLENI